MRQYLDLVKHVRDYGNEKGDRTGTGTRSIFGHQMRFNLQRGFPLVTTKKTNLHAVIYELLWFLKGDTNINYLKDNGVNIWDEWSDEEGNLGPIYGAQWRTWRGHNKVVIDQIANVVKQLKDNPDSRQIIVSAWNVAEIDMMALPPCHAFFQFETHIRNDGKRLLSCQLYQRSADLFLGVPFNIASYSLLTMMIAQVTGHVAHEFIWTGGDVHIYNNHIDQVNTMLIRDPKPSPYMHLNYRVKDIDKFVYEDFLLTGYNPHPYIKAPVAV